MQMQTLHVFTKRKEKYKHCMQVKKWYNNEKQQQINDYIKRKVLTDCIMKLCMTEIFKECLRNI